MVIRNNKLHFGPHSAESLAKRFDTPLYVYEEALIQRQYRQLADNISYPKLQIYYACKANTNVEILKVLRRAGACIEAVSYGEVRAAMKAGFPATHIVYTSTSLRDDELRALVKLGIRLNLDSFTQIEKYGKLKPGSKISVRLNQDIGSGHHNHVITGGPDSKFGIHYTQLPEAQAFARKYGLTITGIHQHIGSNILDEKIFLKAIGALLHTARSVPNLEWLDFGGGFGIPYHPTEKPLNMRLLGSQLSKKFAQFSREYGSEPAIAFEPGRYLVGQAGTLLAQVVDIKHAPHRTFVGIDTGFNHLVRPTMYGSYHEIVNASRVRGVKEKVSVMGNVCESGDLFAKDREITKFREGDIAALCDAGAYGFSMSSEYNLRTRPQEILITASGKVRRI